MSPFADFWIPGAMPVQLLVVFAATFLVVLAVHALLKRSTHRLRRSGR